jgi:hypothetical protein
MRIFIILLSLALAMVESPVRAAWASGGGELFLDAQNPWFVQNTTQVNYCILMDKEHFGVDESTIDRTITSALDYWKKEFARTPPVTEDGVKIAVATQKFVKTSCQISTDLVFQMGYLDGKQIKEIGDPTHYISTAIRTSYDSVHLKGRGFVYLAPQTGPLKVNDDRLVPDPWSRDNNGRLLMVLIHELGHVFGIPHLSGSSVGFSGRAIMSAGFPEWLVNKKLKVGIDPLRLPSFFQFDENQEVTIFDRCYDQDDQINEAARAFFDIPNNWHCIKAIYQGGLFSLYASREYKDQKELIGTAKLDAKGRYTIQDALTIWLPREQAVFPDHDAESSGYVFSSWFFQTEKKGIYQSRLSSHKRPIIVTLPQYFIDGRLGGVLDGNLYLDLLSGI